MDLQLAGQVAVVVGAARGIGRAIAEVFAEEQAAVALLDRDDSVVPAAGKMAAQKSVQALGVVADVAQFEDMKKAAAEIRGKFQRIDHVVFAVGIGSGKFGFPFWNLQPGDWPNILMVNVVGAVNAAHSFYEDLIRAPAGTLTFLASVSGQIGSQTDPPYSASKAALINFAQCAAKDLATHGVRVNTVNPGMVKTALNRSVWQAWADQQPEDQRLSYEEWTAEKIRKVVPLNRWQEPEDIARMVAFLASPAAKNVTGQTINVDGGFVMHW